MKGGCVCPDGSSGISVPKRSFSPVRKAVRDPSPPRRQKSPERKSEERLSNLYQNFGKWFSLSFTRAIALIIFEKAKIRWRLEFPVWRIFRYRYEQICVHSYYRDRTGKSSPCPNTGTSSGSNARARPCADSRKWWFIILLSANETIIIREIISRW